MIEKKQTNRISQITLNSPCSLRKCMSRKDSQQTLNYYVIFYKNSQRKTGISPGKPLIRKCSNINFKP